MEPENVQQTPSPSGPKGHDEKNAKLTDEKASRSTTKASRPSRRVSRRRRTSKQAGGSADDKVNVNPTDEKGSKTEAVSSKSMANVSKSTAKSSKPATRGSRRGTPNPARGPADGKRSLGKTPYQGPFRTCGMFHCKPCEKEWFSAHSWANTYQTCKGCKGEIYPYKQFPPHRGFGPKKEIPPHPQDKCQMCIRIGYSCTKLFITYIEEGEEETESASNEGQKETESTSYSFVREE